MPGRVTAAQPKPVYENTWSVSRITGALYL